MAATVEDAFMEDIIAHPDDDAPRLIFADWLDDHGQEARAEFIRVQIERASLPEEDERQDELARREGEWLREHAKGWLGEFAFKCFHWDLSTAARAIRRGFLERIWLMPGDFVDHAEDLYRLGPLTEVEFLPGKMGFRRLAESPQAGRLREVCIDGSPWDEVAPFMRSERLKRLRCLRFQNTHLGSLGLSRLLDAPCLPGLNSLTLYKAGLAGNHMEQLASSPGIAQLQNLDLGGNDLGALGAQFLAGSRHLLQLRRLDLHDCRITPPGIRALAESGPFSEMRRLCLTNNPIGNEGVEAIARSSLPRLSDLSLHGVDFGRQGMSALVASPLFERLDSLDVSRNVLGANGMRILTAAPSPRAMASLYLDYNDIGDEGAKCLSRWEGLSALRHLSLCANGLTAFGLKDVISSPYLGPLTLLDLSENRLGDLGAQVLARWPGLARLQVLCIYNNQIGEVGMLALLRSEHFGRPKSIDYDEELEDSAAGPLLVTMRAEGRILN